MARFRNYKNNYKSNSNNSVDKWEDSYNGLRLNRLPNKTVIRTFMNYLKYGSKSKEIFI